MNTIGRIVVGAIAIPVAVRLLRKKGQSMQVRHGGSRMGDAFQKAAHGLESATGRRHPVSR